MSERHEQSEPATNPFEFREVSEPRRRWGPPVREESALQHVYSVIFMLVSAFIGAAGLWMLTMSQPEEGLASLFGSVLLGFAARGLHRDQRWGLWLSLLLVSALIPITYFYAEWGPLAAILIIPTLGLMWLLRDHTKRRCRFRDS